ncbi:Protein CSF1 [Leucoagaricus sp. SymC.cos]|nr:Protein CSF1 [Leucoagaricus sp. SymC.cos]
MLDRNLLVTCICIVVALIFCFFYWNRFLGFVLGLVFRLLYWNQEGSSCWVDIGQSIVRCYEKICLITGTGSIHFSLLTGRILLKDVHYHSSNQTVKIVKGQIQWQYWIRRPMTGDELYVKGDDQQHSRSPSCRIQITLQGFEWFLYNRTTAYENIISQLDESLNRNISRSTDRNRAQLESTLSRGQSSPKRTLRIPARIQQAFSWFKKQLPVLDPKELLPLGIHVSKGAITCGNLSTPSLLVAEFGVCQGTFGITQAKSKCDLYKQVLALKFRNAVIHLADNEQYVDPMSTLGELLHDRVDQYPTLRDASSYLSFRSFRRLWRQLSLYPLTFKYSRNRQRQRNFKASSTRTRSKRAKSVDEETPVGADFSTLEYAIERKVLETSLLELTYLVDVVGYVPLPEEQLHPDEFGNGDVSPDWDWQWDGLVEVPKRARRREPASINIVVGDRSSVNYMMPVVAGPSGYESVFEVHLDDVSVKSSLNDIRLIYAESCRVHGDLPSPLKWNDERTWAFDITLRQPVLYLLRDHINMFTDLGKDWASGPPNDWQRWAPTIYSVNLSLFRYEINLYANDQNIIDKPLVREENALVMLRGELFDVNVIIPSNEFRPESTNVQVVTKVPNLSVDFSLPRWNTRAAYIPKEGCNLAKVGLVALKASYLYYSETRDDRVDHLTLDFEVSELIYLSLGWSIRYWMVLRDNYLGSFTNFSTLYEYIGRRRRNIPVGDPISLKYREGKNNMFQCTLSVSVIGGALVLPAGVLSIEAPQLHLRLHDFFFEMSLNSPTIYGHVDYSFPQRLSYERTKNGSKIMAIDGLDIVANRLFGPMPKTSTYLCIWEITSGHLKLDMSLADARILAHVGRSFGLGFTDLANAPAAEYMPLIDPDITFYKVNVKSVETILRANSAALQILYKSGIKLDSNDVGGVNYSKSTGLRIPHLGVKVLLNSSSERNVWLEAVDVAADLYMDVYTAPKGYKEHIERQRAFVSEQDKMTDRAAKLLSRMDGGRSLHKNNVYLPQPQLPNTRKHKVRIAQPQPRKPLATIQLRRPSTTIQVSDSEAEELISEADRDARLAKTRTSTPIFIGDDEQPMSSGDESDDADLTDGGSTESEWTDNEGRDLSRDGSLLVFYAHLMRHYAAVRRNDHGFWETPSFTLTKDRGHCFTSSVFEGVDPQRPPWETLHITPAPEQGSTTVRLCFKRALEVKLTPLLVPALVHLQQAICSINFGPELEVEALIAECSSFISSLVKEEHNGDPRNIIEATCPAISVQILQNLSMTEEGHPKIVPHIKDSHIPSRLDTALEIDALSKSIPTRSSEKAILNCRIDRLDVDLRSSKTHLAWLDSTVAIGHQGPELVTAAAINLEHGLSQCLKTFRLIERHNEAVIQTMTYKIMDLSESLTIVDPLSTIQPSYLVQEGIPHALRTDSTFRFLFHLRNCLLNFRPEDRAHISNAQGSADTVNPDTFASALHSRFFHLDQDLDATYDLILLEQLLRIRRKKPSTSPSHKMPALSLDLRSTCLLIHAPTSPSSNEFRIAGLQLNTRTRPLDLVQYTFNHPASMSQTSLREKRPHPVKQLSVQIIIDNICFTVYSHLMDFVQHLLRVRRIYISQLTSLPAKHQPVYDKPMSTPKVSSSVYIDASLLLHSAKLQAAAANLTFEIGVKAMQVVSLLSLPNGSGDESMNISLLFNKVYLQARSPLEKMKPGIDHDVLAAFNFTGGKANAVMRQEQNLRRNVKIIFLLGGLHLSVPRSAIKLYRFVEEWRADFLPGVEQTLKATLSELRIPSEKLQSSSPSIRSSSRQPFLQMNGQFTEIGISLQVMHGTWLSWQANRVIAYVQSSPNSYSPSSISFGLQIASSTLEISSRDNLQKAVPDTQVKLVFPALSLGGTHDGQSVQTFVIIDFLDLKVKPSHWDTLLAVQQKFGQDFNDLVTLMQETRLKSSSKPSRDSQPKPRLKFGAFLKMRGFRVGFEGFSSTMFLECQDINGGLRSDDGLGWDIGLTDLALSLAPRSTGFMESFNRGHRSVFVIIDVKLVSGKQKRYPYGQSRELLVSKIHTVMHPSSIGEIGDFIDHLQVDIFLIISKAEILERKEQRAQELAAFKQKAQSILKTFEVKGHDSQTEQAPWFSKYFIGVTIRDLGIAFPITLDQDIQLPQYRAKEAAVNAFLFSISSITFGINRGETGEAVVKKLSCQFISHFRQSEPSHFASVSHKTRNQLVYPEMTAQLRSVLRADSRQLWISASVSGFILDLDSAIAHNVFSLIDVYRQGKERLDQLSTSVVHASSEQNESTVPTLEKQYRAIPMSNVFASLTFLSGKVRMYSSSATKLYRKRTLSTHMAELSDDQVLELGAEVFNLPVVSVWAEYRATHSTQKRGGSHDQEPSTLMFKNTVHSSRNLLRPTLLPFLTELVNNIESRMLRATTSELIQSPPLSQASSVSSIDKDEAFKTVTSMRISFSLRIDRSKLEFTCQPDVNVVAALRWESGGFIINLSPGARQVTLTGSVGGLTIGLKHGFLSEDCLQLDARNLTFSVSFAKIEKTFGCITNNLSVILDTELHGRVKFSRLQDILCFKAVWLDLFPLFNHRPEPDTRTPTKSTPTAPFTNPSSNRHSFSTVLLLRVREINLEVDLSQSISRFTLHLDQTVLRTSLMERSSEVAIFVGELLIVADGNLSGRVRVCDCLFQTIRRTDARSLREADGRMLELRLTSGPLIATLDSDRQRLLHYHAEPLEVEVYDDWRSTSKEPRQKEPLRLSFIVTSPEIVAAVTVGTIPKLMSYANKLQVNLEAQRDGASRESAAFRDSRSLKPNNPLSAVAEAMFQTAKTKFKGADSNLSYVVRQVMSLRLDHLRLVVFPRNMDDSEMAQFVARDVRAHLSRLVATDSTPTQRDLRLSFASMIISKFMHHQLPGLSLPGLDECRSWLEAFAKGAAEATIVGLPSMKMHMYSEETDHDTIRKILYDFHSNFLRQGSKDIDDIFITLNVALYSWLTLLRKNMTREMDQVRATAEWRTSLNSVGSPILAEKRKKSLDNTPPVESPSKSGSLPAAATTTPSLPSSQVRSATAAATPMPSSVTTEEKSILQPATPVPFPAPDSPPSNVHNATQRGSVKYDPRERSIERLTMRQLGEATPDVMHPFFMKKAGFNLEDSLPQYVNEYATTPLEEIMEILLKIYSRQLKTDNYTDSHI